MKTKEELNALKAEYENVQSKLTMACEDELEQVAGGDCNSVSNPVAGLSEEEAMRIARQMDEGTYYGPWVGMSGEQFLAWWRASNDL